MYFKETTEAGKTKEVCKYFTKRHCVPQKNGKAGPTPEQMEKVNILNAERKLTRIINANFKKDDPFITLTYQKEKRPTPARAKKYIKALMDTLRVLYRKEGTELKYINVTEYKNKAIHHHLLINGIDGIDVSRWVRDSWAFGRPNFKYLDGSGQYKDLAAYLIKETKETFKKQDGGHMQRYSCSRNLIRPVPSTEIVKAGRWAADPKPVKGYYIDQDTLYNGVDPFTGRMYQRYTMVKIGHQGHHMRPRKE